MDTSSGLEQTEREATRRMMAGLLAQRRLGFFDRLAARAEWRLGRWNAYWASLSRRGRRAIGRRLAPALLGVSLLGALVMSAAPAHAAAITADGTVCTIIEAIQSAESDSAVGGCATGSGDDVITMTADATLTAVQGYYAYADTGLPLVTTTITIEGDGHAITRDGSAPEFRILVVDYSGNLTLNDVTISGGDVSASGGGGIYNGGTLTLNDSIVTGNYSAGSGGGILSFWTMTLNGSEVSYNEADGHGGGIFGYGTLTDSNVHHNTAGRGGGIRAFGTFTLINSTVSENEATAGRGGGILQYSRRLIVTDSTISDNHAYSTGGGIERRYGSIVMTGSTVSGNSAVNGGGLHMYKPYEGQIVNSTITGNLASNKGGGIYASHLANVDLENSTITDNDAGFQGGGVYNNGTTDAIRSLIAGNTAGNAGDEVYNSFFKTFNGNNDNVFGHSGLTNADAFANFTPSGSDVTATSNGNDPTPLAAILSPLADNGGPTMTHALPAGSPAIDVAPTGPATDQRGEPRPVGAAFDAGAYENQVAAPATPMLYVSPRADGQAGGPGGLLIKRQDIAVQDLTSGNWAMHFDGSDVGVNKPIAAFTILPDGSLLLAFTGNINLPGVNGVMPHDVVRFTPITLGDTTSGTFSLYFDGSDVGLTTSGEKIDALDALADGRLLISTTGNALVPLGGGLQQKAMDEDLLAFTPTTTGANTTGTWALHFDGSTVPGLAAEDIIAGHLDESTGDLYLAVLNGFTIGGVGGNGKDILKLSPSGGGYTVTRFWRGSQNGFNLNLSGIELD